MQKLYERAWQVDTKITYPLTNRLTAQAVRYWIGAILHPPRNLDQDIATMVTLTKDQTIDQPHDFWAAIGEADALLAKYIFEDDLKASNCDDLVNRYTTAWKRYGTPRELGSVFEHLDFLLEVFAPQEYNFEHVLPERKEELKEARNRLYNGIKAIAAELKEMINEPV
jgi:hypothetical protein